MFAAIVAVCAFLLLIAVVELVPLICLPQRQAKYEIHQETEVQGEKTPPPLTSITIYWEQDEYGLWRLWNYDRKNLAFVADQLEEYEDWVLWRVFTTCLWPSANGYQLIEREDLLRMGITPDPQVLTAEISGWSQTIPSGKRQVEDTIDHIQRRIIRKALDAD